MSESKIDKFHALRPWAFHEIRRLTVEHLYSGQPSCTVEPVPLTDRSRTEPRLELRFLGAVEVRIGHVDSMCGFHPDIRDIAHWQREGIRFEVFDEESQLISLQCADFEFLLIGYTEGTIN